MEDGRAVLRAGADKVTVNTAAVERPELISELSQQFGAQAVVLSLDVKRKGDSWEAYTRGGRDATGLDAARVGRRSSLARSRRNPAHFDRPRRHLQRIRLRADGEDRGHRAGARDRFRRRQHVRGFSRRVHRWPGGRRARCFDFSSGDALHFGAEKIPGRTRRAHPHEPIGEDKWNR